jgi:hypothetical protein
MKQAIFIYLLFLIALFGCKNIPTFTPENELDPFNENFVIAPPANFTLQAVEGSQGANGYYLRWRIPRLDYEIDGFLLKLFDPESEQFTVYQTFNSETNNFYDFTATLPLKVSFQLFTFIEVSEDSVRLSAPKEVSFIQRMTKFDASILNKTQINIDWQHQVTNKEAIIYLERKLNEEDFGIISTFNPYKKNYVDDFQIQIDDEISYRIYAKTDHSESDTLFSEIIELKSVVPTFLEVSSSSDTKIDFKVGNPYLTDGFRVQLVLPDESIYSSLEIEASQNDTTEFTIENLPNEEQFTLEIRSKLFGVYSEPVTMKLTKAPDLSHDNTITLNAGTKIYSPQFSADGSKIAFIKKPRFSTIRPEVWELEPLSQILNLNVDLNDVSQFYFEGIHEEIYILTQDSLYKYNLNGQELDKLYHLSNWSFQYLYVNPNYQKAFIKYEHAIDIYNLSEGSFEKHYKDSGQKMSATANGEYLYVTLFQGDDNYVSKYNTDDFTKNIIYRFDYTPNLALISNEGEPVIISNNGIYIYESSATSLKRSIDFEEDEIFDATLINHNILAIYNGYRSNTGIDFFNIETGQYLDRIHLSDSKYDIDLQVPTTESTEILYSQSSNRFAIIGQNRMVFFQMTDRWVEKTDFQ